MNVLVPFLRLHGLLPLRLAEQKIVAIYESTDGWDGYWRVLEKWWKKGETFIVLEQDKIPAPGLLQELWDCPEPWCATPVSMRGTEETAPYPSLACTKFGAELMKRQPNLLEDVGSIDFGYGQKEWSRLDLGIAGLLSVDFAPHWHEGGRVEHLHDL